MNVNEYIVNAIKKEGIKHVFSIPGNLVDSLFVEFGREKNIEVIVPAHEGRIFMP